MHLFKTTALVLLLMCATTIQTTAKPYEKTPTPGNARVAAQIERMISPQVRAGLFSGIILIERGDRVIFQRAYGFASWELRVPNTEHTRFGIGSITKPITAALVSRLVDQHRLELQAPVEQYIPGFPRGPSGGKPTIEQLLKHTAGVAHRVTTPAEEMQPLHPSDIVERVKARGLSFEPGSKELYSSAGYTCLARVIEVVEGRSFDDVLAEDIFRPAHMNFAMDETGLRIMPNRALPYTLGAGNSVPVVESAPYADLRFLTGAGSLYATPADLVAFAREVRKGAIGRSGDFGEDLQSWTTTDHNDKWRGWYGRTNAYEASVDLLPREDLIVVILSNLRSAANWQLRQGIHDLLVGHPIRPIPLPPVRVASFEQPSELVGLYGDPSDPLEFAIHESELYRDESLIYPIAGNKYYEPVAAFTMRFGRQGGKVDSIITTRPDGSERVLQKLPPR